MNESSIMQDFPMKDGPLTDLIESRREISMERESFNNNLPRKLSKSGANNKLEVISIQNPSLPIMSSTNTPIPISSPSTLNKKPSPAKLKPTPLVLSTSSHSFLPPFMSLFGGKEKEEEGEVQSTGRFSRLRHKKSKVDISGRSSNSEIITSNVPLPIQTVEPEVSKAEVVSFKMSRAKSHTGEKNNSITSHQFRTLFPPIPIAQISPPQLSTAVEPPSPAIGISSRFAHLLPPVSIVNDDNGEEKVQIIDRSIPSPRSKSRPRPYQSPPATPRSRNGSYFDQQTSNIASLESPIRVLSPRQRSKSVSNLSSANKPKFIEDAFYSTDFPRFSPPPTPATQTAASTSSNSPSLSMESSSSISIAIRDLNGTEIAQTQCGEASEGLSIIVRSQLGPDQFEVGWTCSTNLDQDGRPVTQWELKLLPKALIVPIITPMSSTNLFSSDYRLSSTPSNTSTTLGGSTSTSKIPASMLPLSTSIDEFGLRSSTYSTDFLNGPYSSPRRPSRSGGIISAGSSISSEGPITPKRNRFTSTSSRTLSIGSENPSGILVDEKDNVGIVGSLPKNITTRSSSTYSAEGIEIYQPSSHYHHHNQQSRSSSISNKSSSTNHSNSLMSTSPKSPNHHRFGRYMPLTSNESNILLRKDLKLVTPPLIPSPTLESKEFPPPLIPFVTSTNKSNNHSKQSSISSTTSSLDSIEIANGTTGGPSRKEINKGLRKMMRGRTLSKWSDTENDDDHEGPKTSWSEVKDCEDDY